MKDNAYKENLRKLLNFLKNEIIHKSENRWFSEELYNIISPISEAKISEIHEQCIEDILKKQAKEFYKDFVLSDIRDQLESDFVKMEHWRRRNNIQEFCMALYQQIEAITNYIGREPEFNFIWRNIRGAGYFVDVKDNKNRDIQKRYYIDGKSIKQGVIYKEENYEKELNELGAMDKFKAILFLIVYKTHVDCNNVSFFNKDFSQGLDIYTMRNLNHRGNIFDNTKSERKDYILNNPTFAMCSLLGYYARFVYGINNGHHISEELNELAENCCKSNNNTNAD